MAVPHYNFYPPAGQVIDASDGRVTWDGRAWKLNGKAYSMPSTHRLMGKAGTSMAGWSYDWQKRAWMEPSAPKPAPSAAAARPSAIAPTRRPQPATPARTSGTSLVAVGAPAAAISPLQSLMKHPIAPVLGGVLVAASYLTDEPTPPPVSDALPDATQKQWQMLYAQNQQRFSRRMDLYKDLGMVLLGYSSAQTIMDAFGKSTIATTTTSTVDADLIARSAAAHRAL
jgi:hypothetical protein